ncbi:MAG TPA: two-component system response regulator [Rikenellaceae bacterium]|nr:two-component system response regulator [Rikenellaceae bacterium]HCV16110.1 two-component system response regulator [Rikenellaceae bacterium]
MTNQKTLNPVKKKVLIVDDKPTIAKVIQVYISEIFDCIYFEDPIRAIAWLTEGNLPDLIISDLNMPNMSGIDFLDYIKKNDLFRSIPFVVLSSEDSTSQKIELLEKGADDYISKPFNPMELKVRLKKLVS